MSDEPTPELRALAATLFAAGRAERPGPALGRRLSLIHPSSAELPAPAQRRESSAPAGRVRLGRSALPLWLAAAALLAGGVGLWLSNDREAPIRISAERESRGASASARREERAPVAAAERESAPEERAATPARPEDDQRPTAAARMRPAQQHAPAERVDATPPSVTALPGVTAAPVASPAPAPALTSSAELELLKRARSALRSGAGEQALELLDQHERERAGDALEAEATLLRIETLSVLGRRDEASQLATRFVSTHPNSALGDRARSFIGQLQSGTP